MGGFALCRLAAPDAFCCLHVWLRLQDHAGIYNAMLRKLQDPQQQAASAQQQLDCCQALLRLLSAAKNDVLQGQEQVQQEMQACHQLYLTNLQVGRQWDAADGGDVMLAAGGGAPCEGECAPCSTCSAWWRMLCMLCCMLRLALPSPLIAPGCAGCVATPAAAPLQQVLCGVGHGAGWCDCGGLLQAICAALPAALHGGRWPL